MTLASDSFRHAMRAWTTGVAVLAAQHADQSYAMTINSFTSLSADPPLVTVVMKNDSLVCDLALKSRTFQVVILAAHQKKAAADFAGNLHGDERMASFDSLFAEGLARLTCRVIHTYAAGQNTLFVADVTEAETRSTNDPLIYHNREYGQFARD